MGTEGFVVVVVVILLCFLIIGLYFVNQRWDLASRLLRLEVSAALVQMYSARQG